MTTDEKLRAVIRKDVSSGFMYELEKQLHRQSVYAKKLAAHPDFIPRVIDELVEKQLEWYRTVSAAAVDAAYAFFMSEAGTEWCMLSAKFVAAMNEWTQGFVQNLIRRLENLN